MRQASLVLALFVCVILVLSACKATSHKAGSGLSDSLSARVDALLDQGKYNEASDLVVANYSFFSSNIKDSEISAMTKRLVKALDVALSPQINALAHGAVSVQWPAERVAWPQVQEKMVTLEKLVAELNTVHAFRYVELRPASYTAAVATYEECVQKIVSDAPVAFARYPLGSGQDFFDAYPVSLDASAFLAANEAIWRDALTAMSHAQVESFCKVYGATLPDAARRKLGQRYFTTLCPSPKTADLTNILAAYEQCRSVGLEPDSIPDLKIAFLQVTSPDLIKDKALDFGLNVRLDLPFDASRASMRKAFNHEAVKEADILILVNIAVSKVRRVVARREKVKSTFVSGYTKEVNPEYEIVKTELESATAEHTAAKNKEVTPWMYSLTLNLMEESAKDDLVEETGQSLQAVRDTFRKTPQYISVAQYHPYQVIKAHMDIYKFATVHYYVVDKRKSEFFRDTFDISEQSYFTVCYAMEDSDPNREMFMQTSVLEDDVVRYELEPATVRLSDLLNQFVSRPAEAARFSSMADVQRAFIADRSDAQLARKNATYGYDKYADKRFDSVVVVRNTGTGIGTGFYVTDNMVLTNYHVVEESQYVQLKMFDQREMMGRVVARDAQLDLALIQADVRGRPVCFYDKRELPLGESLEVIGHPDGLEFSITRGVISSLRRTAPINFAQSSAEVLYIQTDAATNGGNSGGPVFYGNSVVGVQDWGVTHLASGVAAQGLNFSIHYSEVFKFLDDQGITVCKGSK
ncbi:S1C family serine protease [Pseudodesulfovibrio sediminis]|uniref:Trypsin-like peptidase domain-containing protein n=1 Tax=Pseudodesulfovibrio sediminis TaxID=2810563 RepID=A0ABM7P2L1_9BACT|nr:S1C family serine protease [Pseudodesulfovibrio sediminis]BCS87034.1 hypothetical protein PSDVSF_02760 [Pseudodesulfovibrio sediminis]